MNYADRLVVLWAANKFDFWPPDFDRLELGTYVACWSEATCDYDVTFTVYLRDGTYHTMSGPMPPIIQEIVDMDESFKAKWAQLGDEHAAYHKRYHESDLT